MSYNNHLDPVELLRAVQYPSWQLVRESEKFSEEELNKIVNELFSNAVAFITSQMKNINPKEIKTIAREMAIRSLVDYVLHAQQEGEHQAVQNFFKNLSPITLKNVEFRESVNDLLAHYNQKDRLFDAMKYTEEFSILKRLLGH